MMPEEMIIWLRANATGVEAVLKKTQAQIAELDAEAATTKKGALATMFMGVGKGAVVAGAAALAGIAIVAKSTSAWESYGLQIKSVQRVLGDSTQDASKLVAEWNAVHVDADSGAQGMKFFQKSLYAARTETSKQAIELKNLGISIKDSNGNWLSGADVLRQVRDKMGAMKDSTERTNTAVMLFGRGGAALLPWIEQSTKATDRADKFAKAMGLIWTDKDMAKWGDMREAQAGLGMAMTGLEIKIAQLFLPVVFKITKGLEWLATILNKVPKPIREFGAALVVLLIVVRLGMAVEVMGKNMIMMARASSVATVAQWLWNAALDANPIMIVVLAVIALIVVVVELVKHWRGVVTALKWVWAEIVKGWDATIGFIKKHWKVMLEILLAPIAPFIVLVLKYWNKISAGAKAAWDDVKKWFWDGVHDAGKAFAWLQTEAKRIWHDIENIPIIGWLLKGVTGGYDTMPAGLQSALQAQKDYQSGAAAAGFKTLQSWGTKAAASSVPSYAGGGIATGPKSGYPVILHGTERVTPVAKERPSLSFDFRGARFSAHTPNEIAESVMETVGNRLGILNVAGT